MDLEPFHILSQRILDDGTIGFDATTAQGRRITAVVPFWNSDSDGIRNALLCSARSQLTADEVASMVRESWKADEREPDEMDDTDIDAATS